jgi:transcriptional regulator of acetoin/glycerol metabolism
VTRAQHLDEEKVIAAYQGGLTMQQCAGKFGTSPPKVLSILRRHQVPSRTRGKPKDLGAVAEQALVAAYRDKELTIQQCADWFGISPDTVTQILRRHQVPARPNRRRTVADPAQVMDFPRQPKAPSRAGGHAKILEPAAELAVIVAYREQRLIMQQCADRFGISRATVKRILQRHGVPARPKGGRSPRPAHAIDPAPAANRSTPQ